jgi:hypothetical protein
MPIEVRPTVQTMRTGPVTEEAAVAFGADVAGEGEVNREEAFGPFVTAPAVDRSPGPSPALLRTLAAGHLDEVAGLVAGLAAHDPLLADIVTADAAARAGRIRLPELQELQRRARSHPDRPLLRWWTVAILGERAFLDADLGAIPLAVAALDEMPDDRFVEFPVLYVRARLRRIASAVYLIAPSPGNIAAHRAMRDEAVADLLRCGFSAEVAITRGLSAALQAIATWEHALENLELVRDARALLGDDDQSVWVPLLDFMRALVAFSAGDLPEAEAALEELDRYRERHAIFACYTRFGRALCRLGSEGVDLDTAVVEMAAAIADLRRVHPHLLPLTQLQAANVLADLGAREAARQIGLAALDWPPTNTVIALVGEVLRIRLDVLDGHVGPVDEGLSRLHRLEALGHRRQAGTIALRMSHDHARIGAHAEAEELRSWGLERVPPAPRRSHWERRWARPLFASGFDPSLDPPVDEERRATSPVRERPVDHRPPAARRYQVQVLAPMLELEVDGSPVRVRTMAAKLLLALLVAAPSPLHVEQAAEVLWPDAPFGHPGRARLNTVVHRLRTALGLAPEHLRRVGDVLVLDVDGWDVDLFRFRRDLAADDLDRRRAALGLLRGNLCDVQFPYDDHFGEHRRAIAAEAARSIEAIERAAGGAAAAGLGAVRRRLDLGDPS